MKEFSNCQNWISKRHRQRNQRITENVSIGKKQSTHLDSSNLPNADFEYLYVPTLRGLGKANMADKVINEFSIIYSTRAFATKNETRI